MTDDSPDVRTSTITLKGSTGFESPWFVAAGHPATQREQLIHFAGLSEDEVADKTLLQLTVPVSGVFQQEFAGKLAETGLGGKPQGHVGGKGGRPVVPAAAGRAEAKPEAEAGDPVEAGVLAAIEDAADKDALLKVYAQNKKAFDAEQKAGKTTLASAFKARSVAVAK